MGKALVPAEYVDLDKLKASMEDIARGERLDPYRHDGSYEICQKAAELYSKNMPSSPSYKDLNMFYKFAGFLRFDTKKKLIAECTLDEDSKNELAATLDSIKLKAQKNMYNNDIDGLAVNTGKFGMFNTPIGTFGSVGKKQGVPDEAIPRIIGLFARIWELEKASEPAERMYDEVGKAFNVWIRGIQAAALSQILHCIVPEAFPVLNGQQGRDCIFVCLGVDGLSNIGKAVSYADNCRRISQFRDEFYPEVRNFREFDLLGFDLPRVHAKSTAVDPLQNIDGYALAGAAIDLLEDEECLEAVKKREAQVNVFEVLGITSTEIRHSRMLAWFLRHDETHGLGDAVLRSFLGAVYEAEGQPSVLAKALESEGRLSDFAVKREKDDVDLRVVSRLRKVAVIVENKVFSGEHDDQLTKYQNFAEDVYADYSRYYVFLTPKGVESSNPDIWKPMSYKQVLTWVESAADDAGSRIPDESRALIRQYLDVVRRNVLDEDDIVDICRKIYAKHRTAIELIIKHRQAIVESLGITEEARYYSELLLPNVLDAGCEGMFSLSTGEYMEIDRDDIYGVQNSPNSSVFELGPDTALSADSLSRALMNLWSEIADVVECADCDSAIQLLKYQGEDGGSSIFVRTMNVATDWESAVDLAMQRGLSAILDLSNDSLVDTYA